MIHIQVHEDTQLTNNDVAGIGLIAGALYVGRGATFHTGGFILIGLIKFS
jgi:aquaporin TIP/aquaporin related protein